MRTPRSTSRPYSQLKRFIISSSFYLIMNAIPNLQGSLTDEKAGISPAREKS